MPWTRDFFEVFKTLRGTSCDHIELLFGDGDKEMVARVKRLPPNNSDLACCIH